MVKTTKKALVDQDPETQGELLSMAAQGAFGELIAAKRPAAPRVFEEPVTATNTQTTAANSGNAGAAKASSFNVKKPISNEYQGGKFGGQDIVGTSYNEVLPTQDYINPLKVAEYKSLIQNNVKIPASEAYKVGEKIYLEEGHHKYVAHMQLGVKPPLIIRNTGGPVGYSDWMNTTYQVPPFGD